MSAITPGTVKAPVQPHRPAAHAAMTPAMPPPTLCAMFQTENTVPRSPTLNQWPSDLPQGGHPIPCTNPLSAQRNRCAG